MSWTRRIAALAVALAAGLAFTAGPASAHSQIISTSPADGAVLDAPPTEVRLTFDAPLLDDTDTMSINDADGNVVSSIHPKPEGAEVAIPWPAGTKPGVYQVAYRVVCGDGHPLVGAMLITINGAAPSAGSVDAAVTTGSAAASTPTTNSATPAAAPASTPSAGLPIVALLVAIVAAGAVVAAAFMARRRKTSV